MFVCTKIVRTFCSPMASFTSFDGMPNTWFVEPVGYGDRCIGNCLVYRVVNMNDGLCYDCASSKDTK